MPAGVKVNFAVTESPEIIKELRRAGRDIRRGERRLQHRVGYCAESRRTAGGRGQGEDPEIDGQARGDRAGASVFQLRQKHRERTNRLVRPERKKPEIHAGHIHRIRYQMAPETTGHRPRSRASRGPYDSGNGGYGAQGSRARGGDARQEIPQPRRPGR